MTTDTIIVPTPESVSGSSLARTVREILMVLAIIGLIACNVATVVSSAFADALHGAVSALAGVASAKLAERLLSSSPKVRQVKAVEAATKEMTVKAIAQEARFRALEEQHKTLQGQHIDLDKQHKVAVASKAAHVKRTKLMASSIRARLVRGTARHGGALISEAVPAVGLAIVIGMAAYDVVDACQTLTELNDVLKAADQPIEDTTLVCGVTMPSYREVVESAVRNWRIEVEKTKAVLRELHGKVDIPDVHIPSPGEVLRVTCPALPIPTLCKN